MSAKTWVVPVVWAVSAVWVVALIYAIIQAFTYLHQFTVPAAYVVVGLSVVVIALVAIRFIKGPLAEVPKVTIILHSVSAVLAVGAIVAIGLGFKWRFIGHGTEAPPATVSNVLADSQFDSVLAYARRVPYDSMTHGMADSALLSDTLLLGGSDTALYTVKAWIEPARDANLNGYEDLVGAGPRRGRVVARIRVDSTGHLWIPRRQLGNSRLQGNPERAGLDRGRLVKSISSDTVGLGYPRLNVPPGVSYVWVDSLNLSDSTAKRFRALIIPDRQRGRVMQFPASAHYTYLHDQNTIANFPRARWVFQDGHCPNTPCLPNGCCLVCN